MKLNYEIQRNKNMSLAATMDTDKEHAKTKMVEAFGEDAQMFSFELRVTQRNEVKTTYFLYVQTEEKPDLPDVTYFTIDHCVRGEVIEGTLDELLSGGATKSLLTFVKENKLSWDMSKAILLLEEPIKENVVFYIPIK